MSLIPHSQRALAILEDRRRSVPPRSCRTRINPRTLPSAGQPIGAAFEIPPSIWSHRDRALAVEASFVLAGIRLSLQKGFPIGLRARLSVVDRVERFDYVDLRSGEKVHGQPGMCKRLRNCKAALQHPYVCPVLLHRPGPNLSRTFFYPLSMHAHLSRRTVCSSCTSLSLFSWTLFCSVILLI
ncbi:hypothetical protein FB45DRAFT_927342 [Roridomyces roridus]|uniref:Uncharacterized protein n=1 Tax=Roridomyces roridus TaxID=1738132 RepID=A0AAD7BJ38_9AGAR|nr:hypothetical protein FB45DRAFT_927342 [Roridomyces roridus]